MPVGFATPSCEDPRVRCFGDGDPLYERYHDEEWGRPRRDEQPLYEKLCLEGFQAGLSWITVLRKREALREVYAGFDPDAVAGFEGIDHLLTDVRLIRSRAKLEACVRNARATVALRASGGLPELLWAAAELPSPSYEKWTDAPPSTPASAAVAKQLKKAGFTFVGPTTVYSLMQACGLVNDHLTTCPVRADVEAERVRAW
ncbi:MAG: DNA-3-methyladenine glycosylase [Actinomycetota bacterium]|jgi:DNA-3-methyladenine glycosylase I|nr:DNA-3-methyladenine glycosylase [Actinomycetota bacterium]